MLPRVRCWEERTAGIPSLGSEMLQPGKPMSSDLGRKGHQSRDNYRSVTAIPRLRLVPSSA